METKTLSIVIPTKNRPEKLKKTVTRFIQEIQAIKNFKSVELLIVDNSENSETEKCVQENFKHELVRYQKQKSPQTTAEASMAHAIPMAAGKFVWIFGDDDEPCAGSVASLLAELKSDKAFYLLNCFVDTPKRGRLVYLRHNELNREYAQAKNLWMEFGFVSATTTLSSICIKKSVFDLDTFLKFEETFPIYSHSVSIFVMCCNRTAKVIGRPLFIYNSNSASQETDKFHLLLAPRGLFPEYPFTVGLLKLLIKASQITGIKLRDLLKARESELRKDNWERLGVSTSEFIMRFVKARKLYLTNQYFRGNESDSDVLWVEKTICEALAS